MEIDRNFMLNLNKVKPKIEEIAKKYNLNFMVIFGSRASGLVHKKSDVDLAYSAKKPLDYRKEYELTCDLQRTFDLGPKVRVDLVDLKQAPPLLKKEAVSNCKILYEEKIGIFDEFFIYAHQLYRETSPLFRLKHESLRRFLAKS